MTQVGTVEYKVAINTSSIKGEMASANSEIEKEARAGGENAGESLSAGMIAKGKLIADAVEKAVGASVKAIAGTVKKSVELYADYEQLTGGIETLFGNAYNSVMMNANKAFKSAGLSANEYMETVTSFSASLIQGLGGDTEKAARLADMALTDMGDNANKMGTAMSSIQDAYQGFAKQNYTMLDNLKLGYGGTASEMARLINDSGVLGDTMTVTARTVNDVSFDKMVEAIHVVQDRMGITGTTAKEASTTIQGSAKAMSAAWTNLLTGMADESQDIGSLIQNLTETAGTFLDNLIPVAQTALTGLADMVSKIAPSITEMLPGLVETLLPALIEGLVGIVNAVAATLPTLIPVLVNALIDGIPVLLDGAIQLFMAVVQALPLLTNSLAAALPQVLNAIITTLTSTAFLQAMLQAALDLFMALVEAWPTAYSSVVGALPDLITNIIGYLTDPKTIKILLAGAVELFFALVKAVPQILGSLLGAFGKLVGNLWNGIKKMFGDFAGNFGSFITGIFKGAINGVLSFIEGFINAPINLINGFISIINGAFGFIGVNLGKINRINLPRLYTGGIVEGGGTGRIILAGDGGEDEWVVPESKMASLIDQLNGAGASGGNITINVYGTFATSDEEQRKVAEVIADKIQELQRSRMMGATL